MIEKTFHDSMTDNIVRRQKIEKKKKALENDNKQRLMQLKSEHE